MKVFPCKICKVPCSHDPRAALYRNGVARAGARRLCSACLGYVRKDGTVYDYPSVNRAREDFLEDYRTLRDQGLSTREIAERMGIKRDSVTTNLRRARAAGVEI